MNLPKFEDLVPIEKANDALPSFDSLFPISKELETNKEPPISDLESNPNTLPNFKDLYPEAQEGYVAEKYESRGDPGVVVKNKGDIGGWSIGPMQLTENNFPKFTKAKGWDKEFEGLEIGSKEFIAKHKQLTKTNPKYIQDQKDYSKEENYYPLNEDIKKTIGLDSNEHPIIKELFISTANQYGPELASRVIKSALSGLSEASPEEIIRRVSEEKIETVPDYFSSSSEEVQNSVANRFALEKKDLLKLLKARKVNTRVESKVDELTPNIDPTALPQKEKASGILPVLKSFKEGTKGFIRSYVSSAQGIANASNELLASEISRQEKQLEQMKSSGKSPEEIKAYEDELNIAKNTLAFNKRDAEKLKKIRTESAIAPKDVERYDNKLLAFVQDVAQGAPQLLGNIATTAIPGVGQVLGPATMMAQIGGNTVETLEKYGIEGKEALGLAALNTAIQYPLEKVGMGAVMKNGMPVLKKLVNSFVKEGITEGIQQIPDDILGKMWGETKGQNLGEKVEYLANNWTTLAADAGYAGLVGGTLGGGMGVGLQGVESGINKLTQKEQPAQTLTEEDVASLITPPEGTQAVSFDEEAVTKFKAAVDRGDTETQQNYIESLTGDPDPEAQTLLKQFLDIQAQTQKISPKITTPEPSTQPTEGVEATQTGETTQTPPTTTEPIVEAPSPISEPSTKPATPSDEQTAVEEALTRTSNLTLDEFYKLSRKKQDAVISKFSPAERIVFYNFDENYKGETETKESENATETQEAEVKPAAKEAVQAPAVVEPAVKETVAEPAKPVEPTPVAKEEVKPIEPVQEAPKPPTKPVEEVKPVEPIKPTPKVEEPIVETPKKVETKPEPVVVEQPKKEVTSDKKDQERIPSQEQVREEPKQVEPIKETSEEETSAGEVVQTQEDVKQKTERVKKIVDKLRTDTVANKLSFDSINEDGDVVLRVNANNKIKGQTVVVKESDLSVKKLATEYNRLLEEKTDKGKESRIGKLEAKVERIKETGTEETERQTRIKNAVEAFKDGSADYTEQLESDLREATKNKAARTTETKEGKEEVTRAFDNIFEITEEGYEVKLDNLQKKKLERDAVKAAQKKNIPFGSDKFTTFVNNYIKENAPTEGGKKVIRIKDQDAFDELKTRGVFSDRKQEQFEQGTKSAKAEDEENTTYNISEEGTIEEEGLEESSKEEPTTEDLEQDPDIQYAKSRSETPISDKPEVNIDDANKVIAELVNMLPTDIKLPTITFGTTRKRGNGTTQQILGNKDYGAHYRNPDGEHVILIHPNIPKTELLQTLVEELIGHFGAENFLSYVDPKLAQHAKDLFYKDQNSDFTNKIRKEYEDQIKKYPDSLYSEWIAKRVTEAVQKYFDADGTFNKKLYESDNSITAKVYSFIKNLIEKIYNKWIKQPATDQEINNMALAVAQGLKKLHLGKTEGETEVQKRKGSKTPEEKLAEEQMTDIEREIKKAEEQNKGNKERMGKYTRDLIALMSINPSVKPREIKLRFSEFAKTHMYNAIAGASPKSFRDQLMRKVWEVKSVGDEYYKEALRIVNEFQDWRMVRENERKFNSFIKNNEQFLSKRGSETVGDVNKLVDSLKEKYAKFNDYVTAKRIRDRVEVYFKDADDTKRNPSERYDRLIKAGLIEIKENIREVNGVIKEVKDYVMTDVGRRFVEEQEAKVKEETNSFNISNLIQSLNEIKEKTRQARIELKEVKDNKREEVEMYLNKVTEQLMNDDRVKRRLKGLTGTAAEVYADKLQDKISTKALELARKTKMLSIQNFRAIAENLDDLEKGVFTEIYSKLAEGRRNQDLHRQFMQDVFKNLFKDIDRKRLIKYSEGFKYGIFSGFVKEKETEYVDWKLEKENETLKLSRSQRVMLYMYSKNQFALQELMKNGIVLDYNKNKSYIPTAKDLSDLIKSMTKEEITVAENLFKWTEVQGKKINEISQKDMGVNLAEEAFYLPILRRGSSIFKENNEILSLDDLKGFIGEVQPGIFKTRKGSNSPIVLEGAFEAIGRTAPLVEKYVGMALPSRQVDNILSGIQDIMNVAGRKPELDEMKKITRALINPSSIRNPIDNWIYSIDPLFIPIALGYKIPVALMQPTSALKVFTMMGAKDIPSALKNMAINATKMKTTYELARKYSPMIRERYEGMISRGVLERSSDAKARGIADLGRKWGWNTEGVRKFFSAEGAMTPITVADAVSTTAIWSAMEGQVKKNSPNLKEGTDEFYQEVARKTEEAIDTTQPIFDLLDKPMSLNYPIFRNLTYFTGEVTKNGQLTLRAIHKISKGIRKKDASLIVDGTKDILITNIIIPAMVESIRLGWKTLKGDADEEDWKNWKSWLSRITLNNIQSLGIMFAIGEEVFSTINKQSHGVMLNAPIEMAKDVVSASNKIFKMIKYGDYSPYNYEKITRELLKSFVPGGGSAQDLEKIVKNINEEYF